MKNIYVLVEELDYADDGFTIIGVFESLDKIHNFVNMNYPHFKKNHNGDYYYMNKGSLITNYTYLNVYRTKLR